MNGVERSSGWKNLKQLFGFKGVGFLGITWTSTAQTREAAASGMNLATALEAERNLQGRGSGGGGGEDAVGPPTNAGNTVKSLMTLIEETDDDDWKQKKKMKSDVAGGGGSDWMCCVCMERNKSAAFIPYGHAFCRVCSRELWLNRGSCPVCNRSILEILDIFQIFISFL